MAYVTYVLVLFGCCVCCSSLPLPAFVCPDQYDDDVWSHRALEVCGENYKNYHCLMRANSAFDPKYIEFCREPVRIPKGEFVIYDNETGMIEHRACPGERFQPTERKSSDPMAFQCQKEKSSCDLEGEIRCDDGTSYQDRTCRCDYQSGYTLEALAYENAKKISCVSPLQVDLTCSRLDMCQSTHELDKFYQCKEKCPHGFYRPDGDGCHKLPSVLSSTPRPVTSITNIVVSTNDDSAIDDINTTQHGDSGTIVGIIVTILVFVVLVVAGFIPYCVCPNQVKKLLDRVLRRNKDSDDNDHQHASIICFQFSKNKTIVENAGNVVPGDNNVIVVNVDKNADDELEGEEETTGLLTGTGSSAEAQQNGNSSSKKSSECSTVADVHELDTIAQTESVFKENSVVDKDESQPDCNEYMKDMKEAAQKKGWRVEDVPKDGSCFYHCILKLCELNNGWDVATLRKNLKKYLESNSSTYKDFVTETWASFLSCIEANKWADHLEISAMAEMLKVPIIIHKLNSDSDELEVKEEIRPKDVHVEEINIGHILVNKEGFHFVALIPFSVTES